MNQIKPNNSSGRNADFLAHYGIKGQQWGVRRFQNEDGTLTEEGKQRYNDSSPESKKWDKREASYLTDEEINRRNLRLQREQQYRNLTTSDSERARKAFKDEAKKKILTAALVTPVLGILGVAAKKNWGKAIAFAGKYAKATIARIKTSSALKNGVNQLKVSGNQYIHTAASGMNFRPAVYSKTFRYRPKTMVSKGMRSVL